MMETKTKAAGLASWLAALAMLAWLGDSSTDFVHALPDWLEAPVYALIPAVSALLAGYVAKHRPDSMSLSARAAVSRQAAKHRMVDRGYEAL